jgi:hypothetical protein
LTKVQIHVNRHIVRKNIKENRDDPAISIRSSKGTIRAKIIEILGSATLIQDAAHPRSCGATIWLETELECLTIDGMPGSLELFDKIN